MNAPDVKKDELSWIGLDDFLKDKPNVTKQEVQDFIASNKIDLQEVRLGEPPPYDKIRLATLENELSQLKEHPIDAPTFGEEKFNELLKLQNIRDQSTVDSLYRGAEVAINNAQRAQAAGNKELANKYFLESEMFNTRAEALDLKGLGVPNPTRYSNYQLAGGENYREILLKLPEQKITERTWQVLKPDGTTTTGFFTSEAAALKDASYINGTVVEAPPVNYVTGYRSSHWSGDMNVLAHMRVNDRIDADGKKMLLVEEIQSDWHQAGREQGYQNPKLQAQAQAKITALKEEHKRLGKVKDLTTNQEERNAIAQQRFDLMNQAQELSKLGSTGVPDAPFKDTWYQLALKRLTKYAADNGYERIGLTTGKQQAGRYALSNEVDEINVVGRTDARTGEKSRSVALDLKSGGTYKLGVNNEGIIDNVNMLEINNLQGKKLADVVGKDIAKQIMEGSSQTIKGEGLNIGGEGMMKYYDEIYPKFLDKYGKKYGAKVGETQVNTVMQRADNSMIPKMGQEPVRYLDVTPEMKQGTSKGQPLFAAVPALPIATMDYTDPFPDTTR
jgi:hypothetical protein